MRLPRFPVDVLMRRIVLANRWASEQWRPLAVVPAGEPSESFDEAPVRSERIEDGEQGSTWRFSPFALDLHRSEGEGYYLNLGSPNPSVFVMWRAVEGGEPPIVPVIVTASYNEAARMLDAGEQVEPVTMAPEILAWVAPFTEANYKPEPRRKVRRNDPFARDGRPR